MNTQVQSIEIQLPEWLPVFLQQYENFSGGLEERMRLVLAAADKNIQEKTGGPFAAAVFERASGHLLALGANLVTSQCLSVLHAEMLAISLAQRQLKSYDLSPFDLELVTSTEPCAMCLGALPWSGIKQVVCGSRAIDAEAIGFDEGDKPNDWVASLERRHIRVVRDICREDAKQVLERYVRGGGRIYNPQDQSKPSDVSTQQD